MGWPRSKRSNPTEEGGFADVEEIRRRFRAVRAKGLPYLVAEIEGAVCGYAYAAPYHHRPAYRHAVENSVYVEQGAVRRGLGGALLDSLIDSCAEMGLRQMVAVIGDSANAPVSDSSALLSPSGSSTADGSTA